jgi:hypothetical protein
MQRRRLAIRRSILRLFTLDTLREISGSNQEEYVRKSIETKIIEGWDDVADDIETEVRTLMERAR